MEEEVIIQPKRIKKKQKKMQVIEQKQQQLQDKIHGKKSDAQIIKEQFENFIIQPSEAKPGFNIEEELKNDKKKNKKATEQFKVVGEVAKPKQDYKFYDADGNEYIPEEKKKKDTMADALGLSRANMKQQPKKQPLSKSSVQWNFLD